MSGRGYLFVAEVSDIADTEAPEQPDPVAAETKSEPAPGRRDFGMRRRAALVAKAGLTEARATMTKAMALRPGSTALNVPAPTKNTSPVYFKASERIVSLMVAAGLPEK